MATRRSQTRTEDHFTLLLAESGLITATGGHVSDETGQSVHMSGPDVLGRYVIATRDPSLHEHLVTTSQNLAEFEL